MRDLRPRTELAPEASFLGFRSFQGFLRRPSLWKARHAVPKADGSPVLSAIPGQREGIEHTPHGCYGHGLLRCWPEWTRQRGEFATSSHTFRPWGNDASRGNRVPQGPWPAARPSSLCRNGCQFHPRFAFPRTQGAFFPLLPTSYFLLPPFCRHHNSKFTSAHNCFCRSRTPSKCSRTKRSMAWRSK